MRLICGLYQLNGADANEDVLRRMLAQMSIPRLKPAVAVWRQGSVAFGIIDFGKVEAPAISQRGGGVMAADPRLDDTPLQSVAADADRLHAMFARSGGQGLAQLLGDFVFAHWNPESRVLTCGRDAFGIRPFSYVHKPGELFAFASLPHALHGSGIVPKVIDEAAVVRRMTRVPRHDDSLVVGIRRLPPAHTLAITAKGATLERYWQLDRAAIGTSAYSPAEAAQEMRRLVEQAVACRLPPGQVGAHLSGGLDSSALSVIAVRCLREEGRTLHAYSFIDRQRNDVTVQDESEYVKAVLDQENHIDWTPIRPSQDIARTISADIDRMIPEDPEWPENQVCARAEEQGVHLVLSGWGGDESSTFDGRGSLPEHLLKGRWRLLAREAVGLAKERGWPVRSVLYSDIISYFLPDRVKAFAKRVAGQPLYISPLTPKALEDVRNLHALSLGPDGRENRWRLMNNPLIALRAEEWAAIGARHGLAFAFPLLDRRVVEFAMSLPSALFLREGSRRRLFRDAMTGVLPERVKQRRDKFQPFPGWVIDMVDRKEEFVARIDAFAQNASVRRVIDLERLRQLVEAFPSPDKVREDIANRNNLAPGETLTETRMVFSAAEYLYAHGEENDLVRESSGKSP